MKQILFVLLIAVLMITSIALAEEDPTWIEEPYDEINYLYHWRCENLELRLTPHFQVFNKEDGIYILVDYKTENGTESCYIAIRHYLSNSQNGKTLRKQEKKYGVDGVLTNIMKGQFSFIDKTMFYSIPGTPEGTKVIWSPQVRNSSDKMVSFAVLWADGYYQIISSAAHTAKISLTGLSTCLNKLYYQGKRIHYDNLRGKIQYSDGYNTAINISNPLRKAVSAPITVVEKSKDSSLVGWHKCDIPEYKIAFYCPPDVFLLSQDSEDQEWEHVLDIPAYEKMVNDGIESTVNIMETKRSYEDGKCFDLSPYTVALIAPEHAKEWYLTVDIYETRDYKKNTKLNSKNAVELLTNQVNLEDSFMRFNNDAELKTIGSQTYAYIYNVSSSMNRYIYMTIHDGRKVKIVLHIPRSDLSNDTYTDLLQFVENILKNFDYYK